MAHVSADAITASRESSSPIKTMLPRVSFSPFQDLCRLKTTWKIAIPKQDSHQSSATVSFGQRLNVRHGKGGSYEIHPHCLAAVNGWLRGPPVHRLSRRRLLHPGAHPRRSHPSVRNQENL